MISIREKLHALVDEIADAIESHGAADWVDQTTSPLGRRRHLELARTGVLKSSKQGRRVLIKRRDIDAFLEGSRRPAPVGEDDEAEVDRIVRRVSRSEQRRTG